MGSPLVPTPEQLTLTPELGLVLALGGLLDVTLRTFERLEPVLDGDEAYLADPILQRGHELLAALDDYRDIVGPYGSP